MKEIDIEEDINHQKLSWKIKKIGFAAIFILILLSLAGLFGSGFLSRSRIGNENYSWIEYEKFSRSGAPSDLVLNFINREDSVLSLSINNTFLKNIQINRIMPQPVNEKALLERTEFSFQTDRNVSRILIKIDYTSKKPGLENVFINYLNSKFTFTQLIYP